MNEFIKQYSEKEQNVILERDVENTFLDSEEEDLPSTHEEARELIPMDTGVTITNEDQGVKIKVTRHTLRHSVQRNNKNIFKAFGKISEIVKKAVKIWNMPVASDESNSTNSASIYYAPINVDGIQHSARMIVKELIRNEMFWMIYLSIM